MQGCGITGRSKHFVVIVYIRDDDAPSRLGVVASKRIGNAVTRNRGKRKVREWFRTYMDDVDKGSDVVIILRQRAPDQDPTTIAAEIQRILPRLVSKARATFQKSRACTGPSEDAP